MVSAKRGRSACERTNVSFGAEHTVVLHIQRCGCIVVVYTVAIVQESAHTVNILASKLLIQDRAHRCIRARQIAAVSRQQSHNSTIRPRGTLAIKRAQTDSTHSPNAVDVLADLVGVGALKLAQLRIPLDLEEDLVSCLCRDLHDRDEKRR